MNTSNSEKQLRILKQKKQSVPDIPAPGRYELENSERLIRKRAPQQAMGKTKRFSTSGMDNLITPAPELETKNLDLDSTHRIFPQSSFPKQSRFSSKPDRLNSLSPSPSSYRLPQTKEPRGVTQFMMKSPSGKMLDILRESNKKTASRVGPGCYEPRPDRFSVRKVPLVTIGNSRRELTSFEKALQVSPGPGAYL